MTLSTTVSAILYRALVHLASLIPLLCQNSTFPSPTSGPLSPQGGNHWAIITPDERIPVTHWMTPKQNGAWKNSKQTRSDGTQ